MAPKAAPKARAAAKAKGVAMKVVPVPKPKGKARAVKGGGLEAFETKNFAILLVCILHLEPLTVAV